jgi:hypothetical protein
MPEPMHDDSTTALRAAMAAADRAADGESAPPHTAEDPR